MASGPSIGIDLGTTNCCAAIYDGKKAQIVRSHLGYSTIPSILTFNRDGDLVVGQQAERQMVMKPHDCIYGSKRLLGRSFSAGVRDRFQPHFAYELVSDDAGFVAARVGERTMPLAEVSAHILAEIRESAEASLGKKIENAVITVPAYFNENQRAFVRNAGRLARLNISRIINEPTAAALCFGMRQDETKRVLVFDLGGGTFDVSIVDIAGGDFSVVGVDGDTFLGGLDFDTRLANIVVRKLSQRLGREVELDPAGKARVMVAVRSAKHQLSEQPQAKVDMRCLVLEDGSMINVEETVTADEYVAACSDLLGQINTVVKRTLDRARLQPRDIDEVLLVGGQTRMPAVQQQIREMFGKEPSKRVHPDEVVAAGAAIAAYSHNRTNAAVLHDMLPMPIGTASGDGQFRPIAARNTVLPADITFRVRAQPTGVPLKLPLFQGDGSHVFDNEMLGAIVLEEASDAREPVERDITLRLDAEGLLTVYANAPGDRQAKKVDLLGNQNPTELVTQMVQAKTEIVLPEPGSTASPAARARKRAAPQAKKPAPASTAPRRGSAKKDAAPAKGGWWQRLIGLFRG